MQDVIKLCKNWDEFFEVNVLGKYFLPHIHIGRNS